MANFGFSRLNVVAPFEAHWREARSAVGAPDLLANAQEYSTLAEAIVGNTLVIGTGTRTHRKPEQPAVLLPALASRVEEEIASGGRVALVFGPEKRGLTREDLSHCHLLVEIPTDTRQPSMNLGQAVAVCLYELTRRGPGPAEPPRMAEAERGADSGALDRLADMIEETMTDLGLLAADHAGGQPAQPARPVAAAFLDRVRREARAGRVPARSLALTASRQELGRSPGDAGTSVTRIHPIPIRG